MKIGIDMDNTICSTIEKINEYQNEFVKNKNITVDDLWNSVINKEKFLEKYLEKVYNEAKIKNGAAKTINELKSLGYDIYIITARSERYVSNIYDLIYKYCEKNQIEIDKVFINGKDKVDICLNNQIDVMIDDSVYNYDRLKENNIKVILFDEHNKHLDIKNRMSSWDEISVILNFLH